MEQDWWSLLDWGGKMVVSYPSESQKIPFKLNSLVLFLFLLPKPSSSCSPILKPFNFCVTLIVSTSWAGENDVILGSRIPGLLYVLL